MYDPNVGRWLSVDPLGFDAKDKNLYRYVGSDPVGHADPTGLLSISDVAVMGLKEERPIDPTRKKLLAGGNWKFYWEPGDSYLLLQDVEFSGSLAVTIDCEGEQRSLEVKWQESYLEAWSYTDSFARDGHKIKPLKPARFLEEQLDFDFHLNSQKPNTLWVKARNNKDYEVLEWKMTAKAKFNLYGATGTAPAERSFFTNHKFSKQLLVDGESRTVGDTSGFDAFLYPGDRWPVTVQTKSETSVEDVDEWTHEWSKGQRQTTIRFTTTNYGRGQGKFSSEDEDDSAK